MTAIIIPAANTRPICPKLLDDLLYSIVRGGYVDKWKIVVCFDNCGELFVEQFQKRYPFIDSLVNIANNIQFAANANNGLRYAHNLGHDCFVLNQDTIVPKIEHLDKVRGKGLATPFPLDCDEPGKSPDEIQDELNAWCEAPRRIVVKTPSIKFGGFCMYLSKELMDKIGYLDQGFIATFEDDDVCVRANLAGFPVEEVNIPVHHYIKNRNNSIVETSTGAYNSARMQIAMYRFRLKWLIPPEIEHPEFNSWILCKGKFENRSKELLEQGLVWPVWDKEMKCL